MAIMTGAGPAAAVVALLLSCGAVGDALIIESEFCDTQLCNVETRGVWAVWWDKSYDHAADADHVLQQLGGVWEDCLGRLSMKKSDRVANVSYVNVYLAHEGDATGRTGQGVGTDKFNRPYVTFPGRPAELKLLHEAFHVCQYGAPSPGFGYNGNSGWYIEASANWYASTRRPADSLAFVEADAISALPHLAMWHSRYFNYESGEPSNWQRYVHQYGMHAMMYYMTEHGGVEESVMSSGFGVGTQLYPQQYFKREIGLDRMRTVFADWTARTVFWEYLTAGQVSRLKSELITYGDAEDVHRFIGEYGWGGTGGWVRPSSTYVTRGWSFNVYKVQVVASAGYRFRVEGDAFGSEGQPAAFEARVLVRKDGQNTYHTVPMPDMLAGELVLPGLQDCDVYLVVSAVPDSFSGFEQYNYHAFIARDTDPVPPVPAPPTPVPTPSGCFDFAQHTALSGVIDEPVGDVVFEYGFWCHHIQCGGPLTLNFTLLDIRSFDTVSVSAYSPEGEEVQVVQYTAGSVPEVVTYYQGDMLVRYDASTIDREFKINKGFTLDFTCAGTPSPTATEAPPTAVPTAVPPTSMPTTQVPETLVPVPVYPEFCRNGVEYTRTHGVVSCPLPLLLSDDGMKYSNGMSRCWRIKCDKQLVLTWRYFDMEAKDFVSLSVERTGEPSQIVWNRAGQDTPQQAAYTGDVLLHLQSDADGVATGFSVEWACSDTTSAPATPAPATSAPPAPAPATPAPQTPTFEFPTFCDGSGLTLTTPGTTAYPPYSVLHYGANERVCWRLKCAGTVNIEWTMFHTEWAHDHVFVYQVQPALELLARRSGSFIPMLSREVVQGDALLHFASDASIESFGFAFKWQCL